MLAVITYGVIATTHGGATKGAPRCTTLSRSTQPRPRARDLVSSSSIAKTLAPPSCRTHGVSVTVLITLTMPLIAPKLMMEIVVHAMAYKRRFGATVPVQDLKPPISLVIKMVLITAALRPGKTDLSTLYASQIPISRS